MKIFQVIMERECEKLAEPYNPYDQERYYDVKGKLCFKVDVYRETVKYIVHAKSSLYLPDTFGKKCKITEISEEENQFEAVATDKWYSVKSEKVINQIHLREKDKECAIEVQEEYSKNPEEFLDRVSIIEDW